MRKMTATAGDIIKALSTVPEDTPVFGYSYTNECDLLIHIMEICPGPHEVPDEDWETGEPCVRKCSPHYCQADSYVEDYWRENGDSPVVFLREPCWDEKTTDTVIKLFKED